MSARKKGRSFVWIGAFFNISNESNFLTYWRRHDNPTQEYVKKFTIGAPGTDSFDVNDTFWCNTKHCKSAVERNSSLRCDEHCTTANWTLEEELDVLRKMVPSGEIFVGMRLVEQATESPSNSSFWWDLSHGDQRYIYFCSACAAGREFKEGKCQRCPNNKVKDKMGDEDCQKTCPLPTIPNSGRTECILCEEPLIPNADRTQCVSCPSAMVPNMFRNACRSCPSGSVVNNLRTDCEKCPENSKPSSDKMFCDKSLDILYILLVTVLVTFTSVTFGLFLAKICQQKKVSAPLPNESSEPKLAETAPEMDEVENSPESDKSEEDVDEGGDALLHFQTKSSGSTDTLFGSREGSANY